MKLIRFSGVVLLLSLWAVSACGKEQSQASNQRTATNKAKVTFIELGSVNCVPCKMMQPVMKQIEEDYKGVVKVVFYDVWTPEQRSKAAEYRIRAIPTQVFLDENGVEFFRHLGYFSAEDIEALLAEKGVKKTKPAEKKQ